LKIGGKVPLVKSPAELTELFRAQGLKVTPQRQAVFRALHGNPEHPTAEGIHGRVTAEMPTVSLRTVYQVLNDLAGMGELAHIQLGTGSSRFDPNLSPHHHLVCDECGKVHDLHADFTDVSIPDGEPFGFAVRSTEIVFRGVCLDCQTRLTGTVAARAPDVVASQP
jgi:Fur family transcriptional regulator, stress-responsive regulator